MASLKVDPRRQVVIEDESRNIGGVHLSQRLAERIKSAPVVMLEVPTEERVAVILQDYVIDLQAEYREQYGEAGFRHYSDYMQDALQRVRRRLGGLLYQQIHSRLVTALEHQAATGELDAHRLWIESLLAEYYDRMYDYQLTKAPREVVFRGDRAAVIDYLNRGQNGSS